MNIPDTKSALLKDYTTAWKDVVRSKPKLVLYQATKPGWGAAEHITSNLPKAQRALVSQLRLGVLPLELEVGRFVRTPREERFCKMCDTGIEDELHFLFDCDRLSPQHSKLIRMLPELQNFDEPIERYKFLLQFPHVFAKHIFNLWQTHLEIKINK